MILHLQHTCANSQVVGKPLTIHSNFGMSTDLDDAEFFKARIITDTVDFTVGMRSNTLVQKSVKFVDEDLHLARILADIGWSAIQPPPRHSTPAQAQAAIALLKDSYARTTCCDI